MLVSVGGKASIKRNCTNSTLSLKWYFQAMGFYPDHSRQNHPILSWERNVWAEEAKKYMYC